MPFIVKHKEFICNELHFPVTHIQNNYKLNSVTDVVSLVSNTGGDIAELMLDFIEWLTRQDFGRRCILSVRDILSWVYFLNTVCERDEDGFMTMGALEDEEEAEWDLRLDTVTAFIHAACLVYIDGIGSGELMAYF